MFNLDGEIILDIEGLNQILFLSESPTGHLLVCENVVLPNTITVWEANGDGVEILVIEIGGCFEIAMQSDFSFYNRNCQGLEKFIRLPVKKMIEKRDIAKLNSSVIEILWYRIHDKLNKLKLTVVSKMTMLFYDQYLSE